MNLDRLPLLASLRNERFFSGIQFGIESWGFLVYGRDRSIFLQFAEVFVDFRNFFHHYAKPYQPISRHRRELLILFRPFWEYICPSFASNGSNPQPAIETDLELNLDPEGKVRMCGFHD